MNNPVFDENDLKTFFSSNDTEKKDSDFVVMQKEPAKQKPVEVELKLENDNKVFPVPPPPPPPGALRKVENSFVDKLEFRPKSTFQTILKFLGTFVLIFIISFTIINGAALIQKMKYFYATDFRNQSWAANATIPTAYLNQSRIIIPKIHVDAPINWNVKEDDILKSLENGVAHYQDTAKPGQIGNIFITGHSSYYIWSKGSYKDVFALLDKLSAGDKIYVQYNGANFIYEVTNAQIVSPNNLTVLNPTNDKTLSLMTCTPVGTNLKRLIITAKQVAN
ncbi:TPA: class E sortase [Candidatus Berkelbacteria bacterium]|uniref:Putative sortase n=1 Tax=Berkelbacteria bacterium GW2011_GWE1_39_12 TaxID=1618337 RepID=A0A0G4B4N0_9BACT|nr:MAG: putative sortase [Berkelbacteria bacterium GW2011_GWE1_39_12]HBO60145.1 class E sortase [Candidatus Berkelbacteria bacterium]